MHTIENTSLRFNLSPTDALTKSWGAVMSNLGVMAGFTFLYFVVSGILQKIPVIGDLTGFVSFIFSVSLFSAFAAYDAYGSASFNDLFSWTPKFMRLFIAHLISIGIAIVVMIPFIITFVVVVGWSFVSEHMGTTVPWQMVPGLTFGALLGLIGLALACLVILLIFIFPFMFIVLFKDLPIGESLKLSFNIGTQNFGSILVFVLLTIGLFILGVLAILLGLLITIPLIIGMQYYLMRSVIPLTEATQWDFMESREPGV